MRFSGSASRLVRWRDVEILDAEWEFISPLEPDAEEAARGPDRAASLGAAAECDWAVGGSLSAADGLAAVSSAFSPEPEYAAGGVLLIAAHSGEPRTRFQWVQQTAFAQQARRSLAKDLRLTSEAAEGFAPHVGGGGGVRASSISHHALFLSMTGFAIVHFFSKVCIRQFSFPPQHHRF